MMAGAVVVMRTLAPTGSSGTTETINVFILLFGFGLSWAALTMGADRYMDGESYAAITFGAQLMISFILEILFISSSLTTIDFWSVLLVTTIYHSVRNMGYMEDVLEWFKIRYTDSTLHQIMESIYTCMDYRMWASTQAKHESKVSQGNGDGKDKSFNNLRIMFLIKTQGEIVQMITPVILILALLIDILFVNLFSGQGTFTRTERAYALLVYVVTFGTKVIFYMISRSVLKYKRNCFTEQLTALKCIDSSGLEGLHKHDHESKIEFVSMRLQITKVYLMSLLLNVATSKYQASNHGDTSVVYSEKSVGMIELVEQDTKVSFNNITDSIYTNNMNGTDVECGIQSSSSVVKFIPVVENEPESQKETDDWVDKKTEKVDVIDRTDGQEVYCSKCFIKIIGYQFE